MVELTLPEDANIYASKYQLYLPSREELADQVARVRREIGGREGGVCRRDQTPGAGSAGMRGAFGRRGVRTSAHPVDLAIADLDEDGLADGSLRAASPLARAGRSPGDSC